MLPNPIEVSIGLVLEISFPKIAAEEENVGQAIAVVLPELIPLPSAAYSFS
jgi:hypothetical protein